MVEGGRQRGERSPLFIAHDEPRLGGDAPDAGHRDRRGSAGRLDVGALRRRRREQELVVVAARQQALLRELALVAAKLAAERVAARDRRELDDRADARRFQDVAEVMVGLRRRSERSRAGARWSG